MKTNKTIKTNLCMLIQRSPYQENYDLRRGRGQGGSFHIRGRGRELYRNQKNRSYRQGRDKGKVMLYGCDKTGQYVSACPDRLLKLQDTQENENEDTKEADELMIHKVVYLMKRT